MSFSPKDRSPTLVRLLKSRLAPIREKELMAAALSEERPEKPGPGACCGSSCDPCVLDQYAEEVKIWKECWVKWEGDEEAADEKKVVTAKVKEVELAIGDERKEDGMKMPGAYDW